MILHRVCFSVRNIAFLFSVIAGAYTGLGIASGPYEPEIESMVIRYSDGSSIAINCKADDCSVQILLRGKSYKFSSIDLDGVAIPSQPTLYSENTLPGQFGFEIKLDCERSGFPPSTTGICSANYSVQDGKIDRVSKFELRAGVTYPLK